MNWFITDHRFYLVCSNRQGASLMIRCNMGGGLWLFSYVRDAQSWILHTEDVEAGLSLMQDKIHQEIKLVPSSQYNLNLAFNQLRILLQKPVKPLLFPSLQSISSHGVSSFFTPETVHQVHHFPLPKRLKEEVKKGVLGLMD